MNSENQETVYYPSPKVAEHAWINSMEQYKEMYARSVKDPEGFWSQQASELLSWDKKWDRVLEWNFDEPKIEWFGGGKLNVSVNCLDRHVKSHRRNKAALIWESDGGRSKVYTYQSMYTKVCRMANVLRAHGVKKGDVVAIYMPMIPEAVITMLACARIGAVHTIVFSGFSSQALRDRIQDSQARVLITADAGRRGGRGIAIKAAADEALLECPAVEVVIVVSHAQSDVDMQPGRDFYYHEETRREDISSFCEPESMDSEDPLFILYTSGSTGKPKGVVHTTGGYLLQSAMTLKYLFDIHDEDVYFCTADIGWITGHSYVVYGPLALGATTLMFEGTPTYPNPGRFWEIVEKHGVNQFYTAPTVVRSLMKQGNAWAEKYDLSTLRVIGSVGEPINPEAWEWLYEVIGKKNCPIVDTWWQTETGAQMIANFPGFTPMKPGSATMPFFGVQPVILDDKSKETEPGQVGRLCIKFPWPSMIRSMWRDEGNARIKETYFSTFPGHYFTGDAAMRDEDGYIWLRGRVDDVINVSGHRMSTAEVEAALNSYDGVAESAVVGYPHEIKGEGIYAYVVLNDEVAATETTRKMLVGHVRKNIGPIASPDFIQFVNALPQTRSGKIMRRILRKVAAGIIDKQAFGDLSTLVDPDVVDQVIETRLNRD
ncbi:MAG: acetate--CoA ligase [Coriobacteriia bacterium]|nr:acetate--CoA ligase [Coriobacteriia bacterium]